MVEEEHKEYDNTALERLQRKSDQGAIKIVQGVLAQPEVQTLIKKSVSKESLTTGCVMGCFFVGFFKLYDVAKTVFGFDWRVDLIASLVLIGSGSIYMKKNMLSKA